MTVDDWPYVNICEYMNPWTRSEEMTHNSKENAETGGKGGRRRWVPTAVSGREQPVEKTGLVLGRHPLLVVSVIGLFINSISFGVHLRASRCQCHILLLLVVRRHGCGNVKTWETYAEVTWDVLKPLTM